MKVIFKANIIIFIFISFLEAFSVKQGFTYALQNDIDYKINKNNLKNIKLDEDIAKSLFYPKLDFDAKIETSNLTRNAIRPVRGSHTKNDEYKVTLTQKVFDGYESKYEKNLQKQKYKSAIYYLQESKEKLALSYVNAYINILKEKELLELSKQSLLLSENIFNKVNKKLLSGYGTKLEYEEAKGNLAENRVNLDIQKINLEKSIEDLIFYIQRDFKKEELILPNINISLPLNLQEAIQIAFSNNSSINVAKTNVKVAVFEERKNNKNFYPNVNFISSYNLNNAFHAQEDEKYNEYKLSLQLKYNLFNGGKSSAENTKALQNIKDKQLLIRKIQYEVKTSLRVAWNNYSLNKEKNKSLKQYLIAKENILNSSIKEFDLGLKDLNSLLDTNIEYIDIKKDLVRNKYDLILEKYNILYALGQLSESFNNKEQTLQDLRTSKKEKIIETSVSKKQEVVKEQIVIKKQDKEVKEKQLEQKPILEKNISFKDKFLSAQKDKFTINLAISDSKENAQKLLEEFNLINNAFYFDFGRYETLQKIVYGIFDTKEEALKAVFNLDDKLKENKPMVQKIITKQKLYYKYNSSLEIRK